MQVCYFTGVMRKVDWQRVQKAHCSCNTVSGHIINPRAAKFNTDRLEGKSSGRGSTPPLAAPLRFRVPQTTEPKWILQIFLRKQPLEHVASERATHGEGKE